VRYFIIAIEIYYKSVSERILKIDQHLIKLGLHAKYRPHFFPDTEFKKDKRQDCW